MIQQIKQILIAIFTQYYRLSIICSNAKKILIGLWFDEAFWLA